MQLKELFAEPFMMKSTKVSGYFFFELDPPGAFAPRRLYFRGSLRLISARFLVPFPPSQNPLPAFPMRVARQIPQFSGLYICSREQKPLICVSDRLRDFAGRNDIPNHAICVFIWMICFRIVTPRLCEYVFHECRVG